jgi:hypothetical protein
MTLPPLLRALSRRSPGRRTWRDWRSPVTAAIVAGIAIGLLAMAAL